MSTAVSRPVRCTVRNSWTPSRSVSPPRTANVKSPYVTSSRSFETFSQIYPLVPGVPVEGASSGSRASMSKLTCRCRLPSGSIRLSAYFSASAKPTLCSSSMEMAHRFSWSIINLQTRSRSNQMGSYRFT